MGKLSCVVRRILLEKFASQFTQNVQFSCVAAVATARSAVTAQDSLISTSSANVNALRQLLQLNGQPQPHLAQSIWPRDEMMASALSHSQWLTKSSFALWRYSCVVTTVLVYLTTKHRGSARPPNVARVTSSAGDVSERIIDSSYAR